MSTYNNEYFEDLKNDFLRSYSRSINCSSHQLLFATSNPCLRQNEPYQFFTLHQFFYPQDQLYSEIIDEDQQERADARFKRGQVNKSQANQNQGNLTQQQTQLMKSLEKGVKKNQFVTVSSINNSSSGGPNVASYGSQSSGVGLERKKLVKNIRFEGEQESEDEKLSSDSDGSDTLPSINQNQLYQYSINSSIILSEQNETPSTEQRQVQPARQVISQRLSQAKVKRAQPQNIVAQLSQRKNQQDLNSRIVETLEPNNIEVCSIKIEQPEQRDRFSRYYEISVWNCDQLGNFFNQSTVKFDLNLISEIYQNSIYFSNDGQKIFLVIVNQETQVLMSCISFDIQDIDNFKTKMERVDFENERLCSLKVIQILFPTWTSEDRFKSLGDVAIFIVNQKHSTQSLIIPNQKSLDSNCTLKMYFCSMKSIFLKLEKEERLLLPQISLEQQEISLGSLNIDDYSMLFYQELELENVIIKLKRKDLSEAIENPFILVSQLCSGKKANKIQGQQSFTLKFEKDFLIPQDFKMMSSPFIIFTSQVAKKDVAVLYETIKVLKDLKSVETNHQVVYSSFEIDKIIDMQISHFQDEYSNYLIQNQSLYLISSDSKENSQDLQLKIVQQKSLANSKKEIQLSKCQDFKMHQAFYINPYIVQILNRKCIEISNIHSKQQIYSLDLNQEQFVCIVKMYGGSFDYDGELFYRHSNFIYITSTHRNELLLNILSLPTIEEIANQEDDYHNKLQCFQTQVSQSLDFPLSLLQTAVIAQIKISQNSETKTLLILQMQDKITIEELTTGKAPNSIALSDSQSMCFLNSQLNNHSDFIQFFVLTHNNQKKHLIYSIEIDDELRVQKRVVLSSCDKKILKLECTQSSLIILDEDYGIKIYKVEQFGNKLHLFSEKQILATQNTHLQLFSQSIILSKNWVCIGGNFYVAISNRLKPNDSEYQFESARDKRIFKQGFLQQLGQSVLLSEDRNKLLFRARQSQNSSSLEDYQIEGRFSNLVKQDNEKLRIQEIQKKEEKRYTLKNSHQRGIQNSQTIDKKKFTTQIGSTQVSTMDSFKFIEMRIPGKKKVSLLHVDDFLLKTVSFSTITQRNDILICSDQGFIAFNQQGRLLKLKLDPQIQIFMKELYQNCLEIKLTQEIKHLSMLFKKQSQFLVATLKYEEKNDHISISLTETIKRFSKDNEDLEIIFEKASLSSVGILYQIVIYKNTYSNQLELVMQRNKELMPEQSKQILKIIEKLHQRQILGSKEKASKRRKTFDNQDNLITERFETTVDFGDGIEDIQFDFEIIRDRYILFRCGSEIFFYSQNGLVMKKLNAQMKNDSFMQLYQTADRDIIQIAFSSNNQLKILTWDLTKNIELKLVQIENFNPEEVLRQNQATDQIRRSSYLNRDTQYKNFNNNQNNIQTQFHTFTNRLLARGISECLNFYIPLSSDIIYDFRYEFPINFYGSSNFYKSVQTGKTKDSQNQFQIYFSSSLGYKLSSHQRFVLGISQSMLGTISTSFQFVQIQYLQYIYNQVIQDKAQRKIGKLLLKNLNLTLTNGENLLHLIKNQEELINHVRCQVQSNETLSPFENAFLSYPLLRNHEQLSPLQLVLQEKQLGSINAMLHLLSQMKNEDLLCHLRMWFNKLIDLKSSEFLYFLDNCCSKEIMQIQCRWKHNKSFCFMESNSRILYDKALAKALKLSEKDFRHQVSQKAINDKGIDKYQGSQFTSLSRYDQNLANDRVRGNTFQEGLQPPFQVHKNNDFGLILLYEETPRDFDSAFLTEEYLKTIKVEAFDIGWALQKPYGLNFLLYLKKQEFDSPLFQSSTIKTLINYQWNKFRVQYMRKQFFPYCLYLLLINLSTSVLNTTLMSYKTMKDLSDGQQSFYEHAGDASNILVAILACYFIVFELRKVIKYRSFITIFSIIFHMLVFVFVFIAFILRKIESKNEENIIHINLIVISVLVFFSYFQFMIQLRLFDFFAQMINLFFYVLKGIVPLMLMFVILIVGFSNVYYILAATQDPFSAKDRFLGENVVYTFLYTYMGVLGQLQNEKFQNIRDFRQIFYIFLALQTFLLTLVFLNLLIALMSDIYSQMICQSEEERYHSKCSIMFENEFLFPRDKIYKDCKFIIKFETVQKDGKKKRTLNVGLINTMINKMKNVINPQMQSQQSQMQEIQRRGLDLNSELQEKIDTQGREIDNLKTMLQQVLSQLDSMQLRQIEQEEATNQKKIIEKSKKKAIQKSQAIISSQSQVVSLPDQKKKL